MAETLAEIIDWGKRLETAYMEAVDDGLDSTARDHDAALVQFYATNGSRLLAVAKAAVECERDPLGGGFTALRAAVRGADEGGNDGR